MRSSNLPQSLTGSGVRRAISKVKKTMPEPEGTEELDPILDQDPDPDKDTDQGNGGGEPSGEGIEDKGEGGEAPQPVKIGEKEYTPEQLAELVKKGQDYDSLLPDYTRKSQRLADIDKGQGGKPKEPEEKPFYEKEGWEPKNYAELQRAIISAREGGKQEALKALQNMEDTRAEAVKQVDDFIVGVREKDGEFDDKDFYDYIARHNLPANSINDLQSAYSAYKEVRVAGAKAPKGDKDRKDSVSGPSGGKGTPYSASNKFIRESGSAFDAAMDAFHKLKK